MQFLPQKNYPPKARQIPGTPVSVPAGCFPFRSSGIYDAFLEKAGTETGVPRRPPLKLIKSLTSGNIPLFLIFNCLFTIRGFVNGRGESRLK